MSRPERASGPELSPETLRRIDILFPPEDRDRARALLRDQCGNNLPFQEKADMYQLERCRFAALKYSDGKLLQLESAVELAQRDWRDLLMATGFAHEVDAHRSWEPKPAGEPSEIDPLRLAAAIQSRLEMVLAPLGFERHGDEWRRDVEVSQTLRLLTGLTSRTEVRFFVRATLQAKPVGVVLHLPRLPAALGAVREQGYIFRAGDNEASLSTTVVDDVIRCAQPWFERFRSNSEVRKGFEDGTFKRSIPLGDHALVF